MTMVCFVLFSDEVDFDQVGWNPPSDGDLPFRVGVAEVSRKDESIVEFELAAASSGQKNPGAILLAKMPPIDFNEDAPPAALWPTSRADMASHRSHWILTTFGSDFDPVEEALLLTHFTHSLLRSFPTALGVLWHRHGLRVSSDNFRTIVDSLEPDELPTSIWIDIAVVPPPDPQDHQIALTTGMDAFDLMEVECIGSPEPPIETHRRINGICEYLLNNGPVLKHGHTFGESESERISIVHAASAFGREGKVIHLVYGDAPVEADTSLWKSALLLAGLPLTALALIIGIVSLIGMLIRPGDPEASTKAADLVETQAPVKARESVETEENAKADLSVPKIDSPAIGNPPVRENVVTRTPLLSETPDWSDAEEIDLTVDDFWSPPETMRVFKNFEPQPIRVSLSGLRGTRVANVIVNPFDRRAMAVTVGSTGTSGVSTRIAVGDLESGRIIESVTVANVAATPMAYSETRQMAWISSGQRGEKLEGWRLHGDEVERSEPWDPFEGVPDAQLPTRRSRPAAIRFVYPMADATMVVGNESGHVVVWNIETMRPLVHYHVGSRPAWAVTSNGRLLALSTSKEMTIVDIPAQKLVAKRSLSDLGSISWPKLDFAPDGSELFLSSVSRIVILSSVDGGVTDDFKVRGLSTSNGAIFVDADHVLVNGTQLISRTSKKVTHQLKGLGVPISFDRYTFAIAHDESEMVVWPIALPSVVDDRIESGSAVLKTSGLK